MRVLLAVLGMCVLLPQAGCGAGSKPGSPVPLKVVVLYDIQGISGGQALWASEDRTAVVQIVGRGHDDKGGLREKRYNLVLSPVQWAEVERLVGAHQLLSLQIPERPGVPDEARPVIAVTSRAGLTAEVRKWERDQQPDFDAVYRYLLSLCQASGEPVYDGPHVSGWKPEGFTAPWE